MKKVWFFFFPFVLFAQDLSFLLQQLKEKNNQIKAQKILYQAQEKELKSTQKRYYPTLDLGGFYQRDDKASPFSPGTTYGARVSVSYDLYDGGERKYAVKQKTKELLQKKMTYQDRIETTSLEVVKEFYAILTQKALLEARKDAARAVREQLERIKQFYAANLATSDDVDRLQSAYDRNKYEIESLQLEILSKTKMLALEVGIEINNLERSVFKKSDFHNQTRLLSSIKALEASKDALLFQGERVDSAYYPTISLEDQFNIYGYMDKPQLPSGIEYLDTQNSLMANIVMRVFDFGQLKEQKEAILLQAKAIEQEVIFRKKEQEVHLEIAKEQIKTALLNIKSAKSAYKSAKSALYTITKKYKAGLVDNVVYLDALANNTSAKALYEKSLNDLEVAYATYYFYQGKQLQEMLQ